MNASLFKPIDVYCERVDASFWSEPINALSNGAFIVAAYLVYRYYSVRKTPLTRGHFMLIGLVAIIGIGSFLFHSFANRLTGLADVIPIAFTILTFYALVLRYVFHCRWWVVALAFGYFPIMYYIVSLSVFVGLGATAAYLPALLILILFAFAAVAKNLNNAHFLIMAFVIFSLSLAARIADAQVCEHWPYGTHFIWHFLNAATLYCCLRFYIQTTAFVTEEED